MSDGLADTKSVKILKRVSASFEGHGGRIRFIGETKVDAIDVVCYHGGISLAGTANGPQSHHIRVAGIQLRRLCAFESKARQVRSVVLAGQCPYCGMVATAEQISAMT